MLDGARQHLIFGRSLLLSEERFDDQVDNIAKSHVTHEAPQQSKRLDRVMRQLIAEQPPQTGRALRIDRLPGQASRIDLRTFEILVPIVCLVNQAAVHVFLP